MALSACSSQPSAGSGVGGKRAFGTGTGGSLSRRGLWACFGLGWSVDVHASVDGDGD